MVREEGLRIRADGKRGLVVIREKRAIAVGKRDRERIGESTMMIEEEVSHLEMIGGMIGENMIDMKIGKERGVQKGREIEKGQRGDGEIRIWTEIGAKMRGGEGMSETEIGIGREIGTGIEVKRGDGKGAGDDPD